MSFKDYIKNFPLPPNPRLDKEKEHRKRIKEKVIKQFYSADSRMAQYDEESTIYMERVIHRIHELGNRRTTQIERPTYEYTTATTYIPTYTTRTTD